MLKRVGLAGMLLLIANYSLAGTVAYEGFEYSAGDGLPYKHAGGTGWLNDSKTGGWRNYYTDSGVMARYGITADFSISAPAGYSSSAKGGVLETTFEKDNTVVYRRLAEPVDLGTAMTQYFSVLKKNDPAVASTLALLTEDKKLIFKMGDRISNSCRITSDFGKNTFLKSNPSCAMSGDSLLVFRLTADGAGCGTVELVSYQSDADTVPTEEPSSWETIMKLSDLSGKALGGVGIGILTPNDGAELYDEIRLGDTFSAVVSEPVAQQ